jgi:hypothetical protein
LSTSFVPPPADLTRPPALLDQLSQFSRTLLYVGLGLIAFSFILSWWSLTRYRVYEQRGVDLNSLEQVAAIEKDMDEAARKDYHLRFDRYARAWNLNESRFGEFYKAHLGDNYAKVLEQEDQYSRKSATVLLRGWSTWTGWFGIMFVALMVASFFASRINSDFELIEWTFPLAGAIVFAFFTLLAIVFYFTVPDANDEGITQGVDWGNYLAVLGGLAATVGCAVEGVKSVEERHAALAEAAQDQVAQAEDETDPEPVKPPPKPKAKEPEPEAREKNRLMDW